MQRCQVVAGSILAIIAIGCSPDSLTMLPLDLAQQSVQSSSVNWALSFDGNDLVVTPDSKRFDLTGKFTLEAWIKPLSLGGDQQLVSKWGDGGFASYDLFLRELKPTVGTHDGVTGPRGTTAVVGTVAAPLGEWHHVAVVFKYGEGRLYLDGNLVASGNWLATPMNSTAPVVLGGQSTPFNFLTGVLDEVRIWKTARSAAQIRANMSHQLALPQKGLVAYWPLNEGTGNPIDVVRGVPGIMGGSSGSSAQPVWTTDAAPIP